MEEAATEDFRISDDDIRALDLMLISRTWPPLARREKGCNVIELIDAPYDRLPARLADLLASPLIRLSIGSLWRLGLEPRARGPFADVAERGRVPLIDIGSNTTSVLPPSSVCIGTNPPLALR